MTPCNREVQPIARRTARADRNLSDFAQKLRSPGFSALRGLWGLSAGEGVRLLIDHAQSLDGDVRVDLSGCEVRVPEELLDAT